MTSLEISNLYAINTFATMAVTTFTKIEVYLKILLLIVTIGYTYV